MYIVEDKMALWITICYLISFVIFTIEMTLVWSFFKRKSDLNTTIIDLVNRDTLILHTATFIMIYVRIFVSHEAEHGTIFVPTFLVWIFAVSYTTISNTCFIYYSVGIIARCFLVLKQRTCLHEDKSDEEARSIIRYATFSIGVIIATIRLCFGEIHQSYYDITHQEGTDHSGLPIALSLLLSAFLINLVCRGLIAVENKKLSRTEREAVLSNSKGHIRSIWAIASWSSVMAIVTVFLYIYKDDPKIHIVRLIGAFSALNFLPLVYIFSNKNFIDFLRKKMIISDAKISP